MRTTKWSHSIVFLFIAGLCSLSSQIQFSYISSLLRDANIARSQSELVANNFGEGSINIYSDNRASGNGQNSDVYVDTFSAAEAYSDKQRSSLLVQFDMANKDVEKQLEEDRELAKLFWRIDKEYICQNVQSSAQVFARKIETVVSSKSHIYTAGRAKSTNGRAVAKTGGDASGVARAIIAATVQLLAAAANPFIASVAERSLNLEVQRLERAISQSLTDLEVVSDTQREVEDYDQDFFATSKTSSAIAKIFAKAFAAAFDCNNGKAITEISTSTNGRVVTNTTRETVGVIFLQPPPPSPPAPPPGVAAPVPPVQPDVFTIVEDIGQGLYAAQIQQQLVERETGEVDVDTEDSMLTQEVEEEEGKQKTMVEEGSVIAQAKKSQLQQTSPTKNGKQVLIQERESWQKSVVEEGSLSRSKMISEIKENMGFGSRNNSEFDNGELVSEENEEKLSKKKKKRRQSKKEIKKQNKKSNQNQNDRQNKQKKQDGQKRKGCSRKNECQK